MLRHRIHFVVVVKASLQVKRIASSIEAGLDFDWALVGLGLPAIIQTRLCSLGRDIVVQVLTGLRVGLFKKRPSNATSHDLY